MNLDLCLGLFRKKLIDPLLIVKPSEFFVNSMSDLFHQAFEDDYISDVCRVMQVSSQHRFQVLTKRSERLRVFLSSHPDFTQLPNVIWGVSVENRKYGIPRMEDLRNSGARFRFLSIEPLPEDLGQLNLRGFHWAIVGGESGPKSREMKEEWVLKIRRQCLAANVPFFFKQWGGANKKKTVRLIYLDPPYLRETRTGFEASGGRSRYVHDFAAVEGSGLFAAADDHQRLAGILRNFKQARIVVSYYDCPRDSELYAGWTFVEHTRNKNLHVQNGRGSTREDANEVLIINGPSFATEEGNHA